MTVIDMVDAAIATGGALAPSFPKTGSSDGSRTKNDLECLETRHRHSILFSNSCMPNDFAQVGITLKGPWRGRPGRRAFQEQGLLPRS
ncbi:hypothetical protein NKH28_33720 [Mesorhizobium sp. M1227]|uniref:hypothetical protein n=1 Tax=Mesorhizobium sp. M1227 TaxID=2957071 RepID=UPI00333D0E25